MTDNYVAAVAYYAGRSQSMTRVQVLEQFGKEFKAGAEQGDGEWVTTNKHDDTVMTWYKRGYDDYVHEMEAHLHSQTDEVYERLIFDPATAYENVVRMSGGNASG